MVETIGIPGEQNGYADSMEQFVTAHENNTRALLNLAAGRKKNAAIPPHDPDHSDNHWPLMLHHAQKGEVVVGKSLIGLSGRPRMERETANKAQVESLLKEGWRREPYPKPQVAVLDPASEKAALMQRNQMLEGMLVAATDAIQKVEARLSAVEKGDDAGKGKKD